MKILVSLLICGLTFVKASNTNEQCYKRHEVYSPCSVNCQKTCDNYNKTIICSRLCKPGCVCQDPWVRSEDGNCVTTDQCGGKCSKLHEIWSNCSANCQKTCDNYNRPTFCSEICSPGCVCQEGWVRSKDGNCVTTDQCGGKCSKLHEIWSNCSANCQKTCDNYNRPTFCSEICSPGCVCQEGWVRSKDGNCVTTDQCGGKCSKPYEIWSNCSANCQKTCDNYNRPTVCSDICSPGCVCQEGWVRSKDGNCVTTDQCHPCPKNEKWVDCVLGYCVPKYCDDLGNPIPCPDIVGPCKGGCVCADNYLRYCGKCIPKTQCPLCGGNENATAGCSNYCGNKCDDYNKAPTVCPLFCVYNGCACKSGYVHDSTINTCVLPIDCPETGTGDDESNNGNGPDPNPEPQNEEDDTNEEPDNGSAPESDPEPQTENEDDDTNNGSVPESDTEPQNEDNDTNEPTNEGVDDKSLKWCPRNEKWVDCKKNVCIPKKCSELGYPLNCTKVDEKHCPGGCICVAGYLRDIYRKCVPIDHCPCCGEDKNATQGCGNYCGNMCSDYQDPDKKCGIGCIFNGCKCRKGYVYNEDTKKCILPKDCPPTCKDPNAVPVSCASKCQATCAYPIPGPCPYSACIKNGCNCKQGYVLSKTGGKCIKISECPRNLGCNGDCNAIIKEFPSPCPPTCKVPKPKICPAIAILVGCECKPGFIKCSKTGKCINPKDCKAKC